MAAATGDLSNEDLDAHKRRAAAAWGIRDQWQKALLDVYDYIAPQRLSTRWVTKAPGQRVDKIFDNTAPLALVRSAGRLQQDLFPPGEPFFALEPGPAAQALGLDVDDAAAELESLTNQIMPAFLNGEWDQANHEMLVDTLISTGAMMIIEGDDDCPVHFVTASMDEIAVDGGPYNRIEGIFFKRKFARRTIVARFPKGNFDASFKEALQSKPEEEIVLCQDTIFDREKKRWTLLVYAEQTNGQPLWTEDSIECPWLTPRYFRMPGFDYGFGPALMCLPTVKTTNKAVELTLRAAAIAMAGIYTRIDDGVFNPDTARIEPGAFWSVARNGGPLGPSIQRLEPPGDLNMGNLILKDLRMQITAGMNDQQLPPDSQSPRSAVEIVERIKQLAMDHAGAYGRLIHECAIPAVKRVIEILYKRGVLKTHYKIDQLLVQLRVVSPLGSAFRANRATNYLNWLQMVQSAGGPELVHLVTPIDQGLAEAGADLGVPAHLIYPSSTRQGIQNSVSALMKVAMAAAAKQGQAPLSPNGDPAQAQGAAQ